MLNAAIIGTGAVARLHAEALADISGVELTAAASLGGLEDFCSEFGVPHAYPDLESLLAAQRPDVVHLSTPPGVHREQTIAALRAGAHVIVEKPAALTLEDLEAMIDEAQRAERALAVVFQQRSGSALAGIHAAFAAGELGRPLIGFAETLWYRSAEYFAVPWRGRFETEGGGTLLNHSIHQIDLIAYFLGEWESAEAKMWTLDREVDTEDAALGIVKFASGAIASIVGSAVSPQQVSAVRIDTTAATIGVAHLYGHSAEHWAVTGVDGRPMAGVAPAEPDVPSGHRDFLEQVYASLRSGAPLPPVAQHPARSMEIVTALYASAARGGEVIARDRLMADPGLRRSMALTPLRPTDGL